MNMRPQPGLTPEEVAFLCEMEPITIIPREKLESLQLMSGPTPVLQPPLRQNIPLWLALLLKKQKRADIIPPPWMSPESLAKILETETETSPEVFSSPPPLRTNAGVQAATPPFLPTSTYDSQPNALPYHWMEMGEILLATAEEDFQEQDQVRRLLRDLREARLAKVRAGIEVLEAGAGVKMNGVGAMEVAESRKFICGVIDSLRKIGQAREAAKRETETGDDDYRGAADDDDDEMLQ